MTSLEDYHQKFPLTRHAIPNDHTSALVVHDGIKTNLSKARYRLKALVVFLPEAVSKLTEDFLQDELDDLDLWYWRRSALNDEFNQLLLCSDEQPWRRVKYSDEMIREYFRQEGSHLMITYDIPLKPSKVSTHIAWADQLARKDSGLSLVQMQKDKVIAVRENDEEEEMYCSQTLEEYIGETAGCVYGEDD